MGKWRRIAIMNVFAAGLFALSFFGSLEPFFISLCGLFLFGIAGWLHGTENSRMLAGIALMGSLVMLGGAGLRFGGGLLVATIFGILAVLYLNTYALYWKWQPPGMETPRNRARRHRSTAIGLVMVGGGLLIESAVVLGSFLVANIPLQEMVWWLFLTLAVIPGVVLLMLAAGLRSWWMDRESWPSDEGGQRRPHPVMQRRLR